MMKKLSLIIILVLSLTSCQKFVEGYDKDPNAFYETTPQLMITGVQLQNQFFHKADGMRMSMMWMNQATGADRQYITLDNWNNATGEDFNGPWNEVYMVLAQASVLSDLAIEKDNQVLAGFGKLYQAWAAGEAASLWGDVIYSQANNEEYPYPVYDNQTDVFNAVQSLLDEAISDMNSGNGFIDDEGFEIYFGGNVSNWIKIAHGLKARFYLHTKEYANAYAEAVLGPQSINDDLNALFNSSDDTPYGKRNPTWQFMRARDGYIDASDTYAKGLLSSRQNSKTKEGGRKDFNYSGNTLNNSDGLNNATNEPQIGKFFGNMKLLTYGEMLLIQTEAILRDPSKTVADALVPYNTYRSLLANGYDTGGYGIIGVNVKYNPYDAGDFAPGGIENPTSSGMTDKQAFMKELFEERYVYFIGDYESFIDYARSHNDPEVPEYMQLSDYDDAPLRFMYPQAEQDANENFPGMINITQPLPIYN